MHCSEANSTEKLLETVVNNTVSAVQNSMPTFVDDPEVVAIDNPCQQSTSEAQVSINGGVASDREFWPSTACDVARLAADFARDGQDGRRGMCL